MSLIKKIDVKKYSAARRGKSLVAAPLVSQPDASELLEIEPAGARANTPDSNGEFSMEHSSSRVIVTPIPIAADSGRTQMPALAGIPSA